MERLGARTTVLAGVLLALATVARGQDVLVQANGSSDEEFGSAVTAVGDLNDDGVPEFAVGAPRTPNAGLYGSGRVTIHDGMTGEVLHSIVPTHVGLEFGSIVRLVGDFDNDAAGERARNDLFIAAPGSGRYSTPPGYGVVISLDTFEELLFVQGRSNTGDFGMTVASLGDADGDGFPDIAVGEPGTYGANPGAVRVFSGVDGTYRAELSIQDFSGGGNLGYSLASLGDINGDGLGDYVAGAPFATSGGGAHKASGLTGRITFALTSGGGPIVRVDVGAQRSGGRSGSTGAAFFGAGVAYGSISATRGRSLVVGGLGGDGYVRTYRISPISYVPHKIARAPKLRLIPMAEYSAAGGRITLLPSCDGRPGMEILVGTDHRLTLLSFGAKEPLEITRFEAAPGEWFGRAFGSAGDLGSTDDRMPDGTTDILVGTGGSGRAYVLPLARQVPVLPAKVKQGAVFLRGVAAQGSKASGKLKIKIVKGRASFAFSFKALPTSGTHTLRLESGPGTGRFKDLGTFDGAAGKIAGSADRKLPDVFGTLDYAALGGRVVALFDEAGEIVLSTVLPHATAPPKQKTSFVFEKAAGSPFAAAEASALLKVSTKSGKQSLKVRISGVPKSEPVELWAETRAGNGEFAKVADLTKGRLSLSSKSLSYLTFFPRVDVESLARRALQFRSGSGPLLIYSRYEPTPRPDLKINRVSLTYFGASLDSFSVRADAKNKGDADAGTVQLAAQVRFELPPDAPRLRDDARVTNVDFPVGVRHDDIVVGQFDNPFPGRHPRVIVTMVIDPDATGGSGQYVEIREDNNTRSATFEWNESEREYERVPRGH